jgi:hypothetical protein
VEIFAGKGQEIGQFSGKSQGKMKETHRELLTNPCREPGDLLLNNYRAVI